MKGYTLTVGLEIHAQVSTRTKMFCDSHNNPDEKRPNVNVCPVCMGHPGTLPVVNKQAVEAVLKLGVAANGEIADYTEFDRKNYFYPDIPKGYQISQYKYPLIKGGVIAGVPLTRIHLEEDTARSTHPEGKAGRDYSLLDFNRAGTPLLELVTEPAIHAAETAGRFARELQLLLNYLGVSQANMEKGEMRVEANVSVSKDEKFGTKVEVKNLNSFKTVEKAIRFEYERQVDVLERGEKVVQETRGWDDAKGQTFSQRAKEESHDYRYFPDPDLPKLFLSEVLEWSEDALRKALPELPEEKRKRLTGLGLKSEQVEVLVNSFEKGRLLDEVIEIISHERDLVQLAANYILTDVQRPIPATSIVSVVRMIDKNLLSSRGAKDLLALLPEHEVKVEEFAEQKGLMQKSDEESLKKIVEKVIDENKEVAEEYNKGKDASLQFLIGQAMRLSKGSANPKVLADLFIKNLKK